VVARRNRSVTPIAHHRVSIVVNTMTDRTDVLRTLPPRLLRADERKLLADWLSAAGGIASAYFCERLSDDPAMYRRIVIFEDVNLGPSCLIHTPVSVDAWITLNVRHAPEVRFFDSLRDALNFVPADAIDTALSKQKK
jgi:hypothetical protein